MLDFGSRMAKNNDHEEDDLFASVAEESAPAEEIESVPEAAPAVERIVKQNVVKSAPAREENLAPAENDNEKAPVRFSFLRKSQHHDDEDFEKLDTCKILRNARMQQGMSLESVEAKTQIRGKYLEALERGDLDELPQQVYVLAYLRKLCRLYGLSQKEEEMLVKPWHQFAKEVPENLPASMIPDEDSENSKILRRLEFGLLAGGAIIVVGIVAFLVIWMVSLFGGRDKAPAPKFDNAELLELQEKPELAAPRMEPVRTRR